MLIIVACCSSTSFAAEFSEACIFSGPVLEIDDSYQADRKYATIRVEKSTQLSESEFNTCKNLVGIKHEFPFDYKKRPLKEGDQAEIKWIYWNDENDDSGHGWLWTK